MDGRPADLSQNPIPEQALCVQAWQPGGHDAFRDGHRHRKVAVGTIVAVVLRGAYEVGREDGSRATARAGEAFLAQDGEWLDIIHHADRPGGTMAACWAHLRVTLFGTLDACRLWILPPVLPAAPAADIRRRIEATRDVAPGVLGAGLRAEAALATLRILAGVGTPSPDARRLLEPAAGLAPLAGWVGSRLHEPIAIDDLARIAGTSRSRLHARFQTELGTSPMAWVRELRLAAARDRLLSTTEPVAVVAAACGFPDAFHFSRAFRARFGAAPSSFRGQTARLDPEDGPYQASHSSTR